jgi:hypothetical protein
MPCEVLAGAVGLAAPQPAARIAPRSTIEPVARVVHDGPVIRGLWGRWQQREAHDSNRLGDRGRVAQWESARFTRERSQVRNPPRPLRIWSIWACVLSLLEAFWKRKRRRMSISRILRAPARASTRNENEGGRTCVRVTSPEVKTASQAPRLRAAGGRAASSADWRTAIRRTSARRRSPSRGNATGSPR